MLSFSLLSENLISIAAAPTAGTATAAPLPAPCSVRVESPPPPCAAGGRRGLVAACSERAPGAAFDGIEAPPVVGPLHA